MSIKLTRRSIIGCISVIACAVLVPIAMRAASTPGVLEACVNPGNGNVTLTWSSVEGGTYVVSGTTDFQSWTPNVAPSVTATGIVATAIDAGGATANDHRFYRVTRTGLATATAN